jgi:CheY-like chemotaxis protein
MKGKVLALIENNIAMRLLLTSRLSALGYHVTVVSSPRAFQRQIEAGPWDWLLLDQAVLGRARDLLVQLARHRHGASIVWLGRPPRQRRLRIEAVFATPLVYGEIAEYFSMQEPRDARHSARSDCRATGENDHKWRSSSTPCIRQ